ncbi:MAG: DEAD/DEAH box helicase [Anaerolineae bacterium]|nr:MAG: DEAD/DEAH box helicase [Anaerolineae bacterium]
MAHLSEADVESLALDWLKELGWVVRSGEEFLPETPGSERQSLSEVILVKRLKQAIERLNPHLPSSAHDEAFRKVTHLEGGSLERRNRAFHRMLTDGVTVEYRRADGNVFGTQVRLVDFDILENNEFLAVNQFSVLQERILRRPDIVLFLNGLPLVVFELKNPADASADIWKAYQQFQTYKHEISNLFETNEMLVISDGLTARIGTLTAGREWFKPWRTIEGESLAPETQPELEVLLKGVFEPRRFLTLLRHFIVYEDRHGKLSKKMAGYHQFHAVNVAVEETLRASRIGRQHISREERGVYWVKQQLRGKPGDRRIGVVWHTQGAGKSLTMAFYVGRLMLHPQMENPTIVVLTDRNDLDDQLFENFSRVQDILRESPIQAESRADLREKLRRSSGGIVFTTIQKFFPENKAVNATEPLSERGNIVVIADEAHRSQYDFIDGFARHMRDALPNASFIAFTGTPIEFEDRNTRAVFGDYISIYDIQRAVEDGATVPIYYESRLAKLALDENERPRLDPEFEEVTEGEEVERKEELKRKWTQLEALVGSPKRLRLIAEDIVQHFEARLEALDGKAMIVVMSRRIAVELYNYLIELRPQWHHPDDDKGMLKVVMTGSASDPLDWQPHIRNKARRLALAERFRDPTEPFKIVIVRDMWLTGFDAPSLHTLYLDKPMRGHGLMQAIARVNRVFRDKPGGLVVDYLGLADELRAALATYTRSGGKGDTAIPLEQAVAIMLEKYDICRSMLHGLDYSSWWKGDVATRLALLPFAQEHILAQEDGKTRFVQAVRELSRAFALATPSEQALRIRDEVAFFQELRAALLKRPEEGQEVRSPEDIELAVRQLVSQALVGEGVLDLFAVAGLEKPQISILSEEFLLQINNMSQKHLAVEVLRKLLEAEIRKRGRKNIVQGRSFAQMLEEALRRYQNRAIETVQVIEELLELARQLREADRRGEDLRLSEEELAFYDALETNDSAVKVLGDQILCQIARELAETVRNNASIDWTRRESVRAKLRVLVKRILRKYGYPPDKQEKATQTVLEQAEVLTAIQAED